MARVIVFTITAISVVVETVAGAAVPPRNSRVSVLPFTITAISVVVVTVAGAAAPTRATAEGGWATGHLPSGAGRTAPATVSNPPTFP